MNAIILALAIGLQATPPPSQTTPPGQPVTEEEARHQKDLENDRRIGKEYSEEVEKELKLSTDEDKIALVKGIGQEMAEIANASQVSVLWGDRRKNTFEYTFKLVEGDDVNAFSLPGGYIYVYEGLVDFAESEDELAAVLAHEIAHASFRHVDSLRREQSKFDIFRIPLIIAAALSRSQDAMSAAVAAELAAQGVTSGWSVKAETSADYGGLQYLRKSRFNPVAMLTFMERLSYRERLSPQLDWGIYRTHPPSNDRASFLIKSLNQMGIPIRRSETTRSLSARSSPQPDGSYEFTFGDTPITTFRGPDAKSRAAQAVLRVNAFMDSVPDMFQLSTNGNELMGNGRTLFEVQSSDVATGSSVAEARDRAVANLKKVIADLSVRLFRA